MSILERNLGMAINFPNGLIARECEWRFCSLTSENAHEVFVDAMRKRQTDPESVEFFSRLPKSLRALGYATPPMQIQMEANSDNGRQTLLNR